MLKTYSPVTYNTGRGVVTKRGSPTDNLNINKHGGRGVGQIKGRGVRKMFSVKSGNPLSLLMGVPNSYL